MPFHFPGHRATTIIVGLVALLPILSSGAEEALAARMEAYLKQSFPAKIREVEVKGTTIHVAGTLPAGSGECGLVEIPIETEAGEQPKDADTTSIHPNGDGSFAIDLPRKKPRGEKNYDRLLSRWQIIGKADGAPLSAAHYADEVSCRSPQLPPATLKSKKGLGGWGIGTLPDEIKELGISAVTVNVMVHSLVSLSPGDGKTAFEWRGRTYYAQDKALEGFDNTFREAEKQGVMVSAILLIPNPAKDSNPVVKVMGHPDATKEGTFAMPNLTTEEGVALYGAALNLMAERWSRPDGKYGRVHHWIMHNEVDAGWEWTNAGDKPDIVYMDLYQRSMRMMDLIARQYDPNSRPFISLTQHWANKGLAKWYGSKRLLELLQGFGRTEGEFPWGLAYHPYPQDLTNPRTWEDGQATFSFNTEKITPKNLEVLDAYMKQPALQYRGKMRPVHLTENGFNSRDYSAEQLACQAAGMALAWKKMAALSSIQVWDYHNWIDNRHEGGLKIGLRKFRDEQGDPLGKKPIWFLYQAFGTKEEDKVAEPYLKTIGIKSWGEIIHREEIR
ncbi:DUF5722 domain-containing protein [Haloferula sp. BvORR071]|uniref:DUF5722 domain-containing protein n=1 Tax=Haloferula sp. BvORR071 TaxID=1396141 RepID=UPI002240FA06|nr:DUF5722 domain-containing protein [Haloferula sp. BvORR071]